MRYPRTAMSIAVALTIVPAVGGIALWRHTRSGTRKTDIGATRDNAPVIAAAGDIACSPSSPQFHGGSGTRSNCRELAVSQLLQGAAAVLALGDTQYECGDASAIQASYDLSWGRFKSITHPAIGNHEYGRACGRNDPSPYFDYFGSAAGNRGQGWYSFDLGGWHLIALNSECTYGHGPTAVGGCGPGSAQEEWVKNDLQVHRNVCTLAYWHEPRFTSGRHGDAQQMAYIWNDLARAHADIVLAGHNHDYERFDPTGVTPPQDAIRGSTTTLKPNYQNPVLDPKGIRAWVVGTGGKNHDQFGTHPALTGEIIRDAKDFGVLKLTLQSGSYIWSFVEAKNHTVVDQGHGLCN
jgi:hypothetical protein